MFPNAVPSAFRHPDEAELNSRLHAPVFNLALRTDDYLPMVGRVGECKGEVGLNDGPVFTLL